SSSRDMGFRSCRLFFPRRSRGWRRIGSAFTTGQPHSPVKAARAPVPGTAPLWQNRAETRDMQVDLGRAQRHGAARNRPAAPLFPFPPGGPFSMDVATSPSAQDSLVTPGNHRDLANAIRALAMDAVQKANSGHPGMPMGMADVATVLFTRFLKFDPATPAWSDRDRFVLSAGHGSMLDRKSTRLNSS